MTRPYHFRRVVDGLVRTCRKCGEDYPFTPAFYAVARYRKDGSPILRGTCTACRTERRRANLPPKMGASRLVSRLPGCGVLDRTVVGRGPARVRWSSAS
jgi:RNase P subunit RPR2